MRVTLSRLNHSTRGHPLAPPTVPPKKAYGSPPAAFWGARLQTCNQRYNESHSERQAGGLLPAAGVVAAAAAAPPSPSCRRRPAGSWRGLACGVLRSCCRHATKIRPLTPGLHARVHPVQARLASRTHSVNAMQKRIAIAQWAAHGLLLALLFAPGASLS